MFYGAITALVTPFKNGALDINKFKEHVNWQVQEGIHGLVVCGSTGEAATLTDDERGQLITACVEEVKGRVPVMVGTGSNSTEKTIEHSKQAEALGADGLLIVAPYYNKPTQAGIYAHYEAIHNATNVPIYIYNVPGRTVTNIADETIAKLAGLKRIVGVKDATGDLTRPLNLFMHLEGKDFTQFSGEDATAVAFNVNGGKGVISVVSNIVPSLVAKMQQYTLDKNYDEALKLQQKLHQLIQGMFIETNPSPAKYALYRMGRMSDEVRLPLVGLNDNNRKAVDNALAEMKLLK